MIKVGIAEYKTAKHPQVLSCVGLGSCVGICLHDPISKIGGIAHVLLPDSTINTKDEIKPGKFADTAVVALLGEIEKQGGSKRNIKAKVVGGASMFTHANPEKDDFSSMGMQNVEAAKDALTSVGVDLSAEDTGGNHGRTIEFHIDTGKILIKTKNGVTEI